MGKELSDKMVEAMKSIMAGMLIFTILSLASGCSKDGGVCVSTTGPVIRETRSISAFNQIEIVDNVSLILTNDTGNQVTVEAGQRIIGGVKTEVREGILTLSNSNTCNWLRDYKKPINVYLPGNRIWRINYNGSGDVTSNGTLKLDSLKVEVWGGCGSIDLSVDLWQGSFSLNLGTVDMKLHGVCAITTVYAGDYGLYDARDLRTGYTYITNIGSNDSYVKAINYLDANISSIGNIYYVGEPASINVKISGSGKLLPL